MNWPHEMVELDVEARQGDSGGPIFNSAGELAGVLFGAGQGTTLGSFAPRVRVFLASVAPDIDQASGKLVAVADRPQPTVISPIGGNAEVTKPTYPSAPWTPPIVASTKQPPVEPKPQLQLAGLASAPAATPVQNANASGASERGLFEPVKTLLAAVGLTAITLRLLKTVR